MSGENVFVKFGPDRSIGFRDWVPWFFNTGKNQHMLSLFEISWLQRRMTQGGGINRRLLQPEATSPVGEQVPVCTSVSRLHRIVKYDWIVKAVYVGAVEGNGI